VCSVKCRSQCVECHMSEWLRIKIYDCFSEIGQPCQEDRECSVANAYCQRKLDGNSVCTCEIAYLPSADRSRCLPTYRGLLSATTLGYPCHTNLECQLADPNSICIGGNCDCAVSNSTECNAKNTGCHRSTFQVRESKPSVVVMLMLVLLVVVELEIPNDKWIFLLWPFNQS